MGIAGLPDAMSMIDTPESDRGLTLVFSALLLVGLMLLASFAVDLGGVYVERREDQNAADAGATAGALELSSSDATVVAEVKGVVHGTLGTTLTSAQWNSCGTITDPDPVDTPLAGANCITVDGSRRRIQVRIPTRQYDAAFAPVVGIEGFDHSAFAIAGEFRAGLGGVLPFGLGPGSSSGDGYVCVKSGPGGHSEPPCDGSSSGNFGFLDFATFGDTELGTTLDCSNGNQRPRNANTVAVGNDHDLSRYNEAPHFVIEVIDTGASCGATREPNAAYSLTGNTPQNVGSGLYSGSAFSDGGPARLQRSGAQVHDGSGLTTNVGGHILDDNPLWEFLPETFSVADDVPDSCDKQQFTRVLAGDYSLLPTTPANVQAYISAQPTSTARMRKMVQRCLTHYRGETWTDQGAISPIGEPSAGCSASACTGVLFSRNSQTNEFPDLYDIQYTSRFGYVPELQSPGFPTGTGVVRFASFQPIFFQRLLAGNCSSSSCTHDFEPGVGYVNSSPEDKADGITAFVLPRASLPNDLGSETAPFDLGKNRFVELIR